MITDIYEISTEGELLPWGWADNLSMSELKANVKKISDIEWVSKGEKYRLELLDKSMLDFLPNFSGLIFIDRNGGLRNQIVVLNENSTERIRVSVPSVSEYYNENKASFYSFSFNKNEICNVTFDIDGMHTDYKAILDTNTGEFSGFEKTRA